MVAVQIPGAIGRLRVARVALGSASVENGRLVGIELREVVALAGRHRGVVVRSTRLIVVGVSSSTG